MVGWWSFMDCVCSWFFNLQDEIVNLREHLGNLQQVHSRESELKHKLAV